MKCPMKVNCYRHRHTQGAKDADRLWPKLAMQSVVPSDAWDTRTYQTAGVNAGANSFMSSVFNIVNPTPCPGFGAGTSARKADGVAGRGGWRKRRPFCNGADRDCNIIPPCKRADFQLVVNDEKTRRTFIGGNSK